MEGKPSLAIAISLAKKRKMAKGGPVKKEQSRDPSSLKDALSDASSDESKAKSSFGLSDDDLDSRKKSYMAMAHGGSIVDSIMKKKALMMAQGGQVPESLDYLDLDDSYPDPDYRELDMLDPDADEMFPGSSMDPSEDRKSKKKKMLDMIFSGMGKDD